MLAFREQTKTFENSDAGFPPSTRISRGKGVKERKHARFKVS